MHHYWWGHYRCWYRGLKSGWLHWNWYWWVWSHRKHLTCRRENLPWNDLQSLHCGENSSVNQVNVDIIAANLKFSIPHACKHDYETKSFLQRDSISLEEWMSFIMKYNIHGTDDSEKPTILGLLLQSVVLVEAVTFWTLNSLEQSVTARPSLHWVPWRWDGPLDEGPSNAPWWRNWKVSN